MLTTTAPVNGTFCDTEICASPVPGGMSTINTSVFPHIVSRIIVVSAPLTIGPRHVAARPGGRMKPMD